MNTKNPIASAVLVAAGLWLWSGTGVELRAQLTEGYITQVENINTNTPPAGGLPDLDSDPSNLAPVASWDAVVYSADDGNHGREAWFSDEAETIMPEDLYANGDSTPQDFVEFREHVYFSAAREVNDRVLYKWESKSGTPSPVATPGGVSEPSNPNQLTVSGANLFFVASDGSSANELWRTDGMGSGPMPVRPPPGHSNPTELVNAGGVLFFSAVDANGRELWRSDGSPSGTRRVKDIRANALSSGPEYLVALGTSVLFSANGGSHGRELWFSDGTEASTYEIMDINPNAASSNPKFLATSGNRVFFGASNGSGPGEHGNELWIYDHGTGQARLVRDINTQVNPFGQPDSSDPEQLLAVGANWVVFVATDGLNGRELWISDGTLGGTVMVGDIHPTGDSLPRDLVALDDIVFFSADDGTGDRWLWAYDTALAPSPAGLQRIEATDPNKQEGLVGLRNPENLTRVGFTIYFSAEDDQTGRELWRYFPKAEFVDLGESFGPPDGFVPGTNEPPYTIIKRNRDPEFDPYFLDREKQLLAIEPASACEIQWQGEVQTTQLLYIVRNRAVSEPMPIYDTDGAGKGRSPTVEPASGRTLIIHHNSVIRTQETVESNGIPVTVNNQFYLGNDGRLHADTQAMLPAKAMIVMHYEDGAGNLEGVEVVEVRKYTRVLFNESHLAIGSRLQPHQEITGNIVRRHHIAAGKKNEKTDNEYIWQHRDQNPAAPGQPSFDGAMFAVKRNAPETVGVNPLERMEVAWLRNGLFGVEWPYEIHRYTTFWPEDAQRYVRRGDSTEPKIVLPAELNPFLMREEQFDEGSEFRSHGPPEETAFWTDGGGERSYSLISYEKGPASRRDWVGFQVIRSVWRTDDRFYDLQPEPWPIGLEITNEYHQGEMAGYIYVAPTRTPETDLYWPEAYGEQDPFGWTQGHVYGVNEGLLEVWWSTLNTQTPVAVQWPSLVSRYINIWPENPPRIVIASEQGTGGINPEAYPNKAIYVQNDPNRPGFNPNDEHALVADPNDGAAWSAIYALRDDLGVDSKPYVLMAHERPGSVIPDLEVYAVTAETATISFRYNQDLVKDVQGTLAPVRMPVPLDAKFYGGSPSIRNYISQGRWIKDRKGTVWPIAAGDDGGTRDLVTHYYYTAREDYHFPSGYEPEDLEHVPWLDERAGTPGIPLGITNVYAWTEIAPTLLLAETLTVAKRGLPDIWNQKSVEIVYQQASPEHPTHPTLRSVALIDPLRMVSEELGDDEAVPAALRTEPPVPTGEKVIFLDLPPQLRKRLTYNAGAHRLELVGEILEEESAERAWLQLNVITQRERAYLLTGQRRDGTPLFTRASDFPALARLCDKADKVIEIERDEPAVRRALTAGLADDAGFVTLMMNSSTNTDLVSPGDPVSGFVIQVEPDLFSGLAFAVDSDNIFDETSVVRHQADFAGLADRYEFEWQRRPASSSTWGPHVTEMGAVDTVLSPENTTPTVILSDVFFRGRYRPTDPGHPQFNIWSDWTQDVLIEGWMKRVLRKVNPFAVKTVSEFGQRQVNDLVSMISLAGPRAEGSVALNQDAIDAFGLIELYETVFNRGAAISIGSGLNDNDINRQLLFAATRLCDLYMLLGNEAFADAADPTIGFGTDSGEFGNEATSIHCFMNQTASLLEEELKLLRGRDDSMAPLPNVPGAGPIYNRLTWNFTSDQTGGEVAYALNYQITDQNEDGAINHQDAQILYPQGHGDAWGHYLTATKVYYDLLQNSNFTWIATNEPVRVGSRTVDVDYFDERRFAAAAAAKARTGAEIVNLTFRKEYREEPNAQFDGYQDSDPRRAWGLPEWGKRAGQAAYFDWLAVNTLIPPVDPNSTLQGIERVDRSTVHDLREVVAQFSQIQAQLDAADSGLNPLGLTRNVVPFDIDPSQVDQGKSHFEQIYDRAVSALNNAIAVFNHAQGSAQRLRRQGDSVQNFNRSTDDRLQDIENRLIEIFGYPYDDDIGPGGLYPQGYDSYDEYNFEIVDIAPFVGRQLPTREFDLEIRGTVVDPLAAPDGEHFYRQTTNNAVVFLHERFGRIKPANWTGERRAPGEVQVARGQLLETLIRQESAVRGYENLLDDIEDQAALLDSQYDLNENEILLLNVNVATQQHFNAEIKRARKRANAFHKRAQIAVAVANAVAEGFPQETGFIAGLASGVISDFTFTMRSAVRLAGTATAQLMNDEANQAGIDELGHQQAKEIAQAQSNIELTTLRQDHAILERVAQLEKLMRQEALQRLELYVVDEAMRQAAGRYTSVLARGQRLKDERERVKNLAAAQLQEYRYKDMAFRIFRDDALQKYRAQFDLAARYVFLAARAYDYETNLRRGGAGSAFLNDIIQARSIGTIVNGIPQTGGNNAGLADAMARMMQNWSVLEGQMGFNNPQTETGRFSLRKELFRIKSLNDPLGDNEKWRGILRRSVVDNVLDLPEFQRYCLPFFPQLAEEPAIVIRFPTSINFGFNFFGYEAGGADNSYDSANFATKVRSVGIWFSGYANTGLSNTPRVYLVPIGADVMRIPGSAQGETREWTVAEQVLPMPFAFAQSDLNEPRWIPMNDTLFDEFARIRRHGRILARHDGGAFSAADMVFNSRLIGRSVWNTEWMLIIPAGTLHFDRDLGIERFIEGGVSDILIFFQTYAFQGS